MTEEEKNEYKISIPLITEDELNKIDEYQNTLIQRISKTITKDKDLLMFKRIIKNQKQQIEKQNKMIALMADFIDSIDKDEDICRHIGKPLCEDYKAGKCKECLIEYFEKKVRKA